MSDVVPSPRELQILKILWEIGPGTVREVHDRMQAHGKPAFNTVQTLLRIMDEKGLVAHLERGRKFVYSPRVTRDREVARVVDQLFDGALDQFVLSLLRTKKASPRELQELARIIADARGRKEQSVPRRA